MLATLLGTSEPKFRAGTPEPTHPFWYHDLVQMSDSGHFITPDTSMNVPAVYACVRVLAEAVAQLPCKVYRRREDGGKDVAVNHWLYNVVHDQPNYYQTAFEFWEYAMYCLLLRGNFYADIHGNGSRLQPIEPERVKKVRLSGDRLIYEVEREKGRPENVMQEDMFHVRGLSADGMLGLSPITLLRNAIGMSRGAEQFGNSMFKNGVKPSGVYTTDSRLSPDAYARLKDSLAMSAGSANANKTLILEEGLKWQQVSLTAEDAQFLETRKFQLEEIARAFKVPLHKLQSLDKATFSNIEHQAIEFVVDTLTPWLRRIESAIKRDLINHDGVMFAEFMVDALLRGDIESRYTAYANAIQNEWLSTNEVRNKENMNPREGGDEYKNPAINPQQRGGESPSQAPQNNQQAVSQAWAADISERLARMEINEVQRRAKHQASDPKRFAEWAQEFYTAHAQTVDQVISQYCDIHQVRQADRIAAVKDITAGHVRELLNGNAAELVTIWESQLPARLQQTLIGMVT